MKLATYRANGSLRVGLVHGENKQIFDLAAAAERNGERNPAFESMLSLIDSGPSGLEDARAAFEKFGKDADLSAAVASTEILAPVPEPRQMRDGMSFPL